MSKKQNKNLHSLCESRVQTQTRQKSNINALDSTHLVQKKSLILSLSGIYSFFSPWTRAAESWAFYSNIQQYHNKCVFSFVCMHPSLCLRLIQRQTVFLPYVFKLGKENLLQCAITVYNNKSSYFKKILRVLSLFTLHNIKLFFFVD